MGTKTVLVTGDVIVDHHIYQGDRESPAAQGSRGTLVSDSAGGAALLNDLLAEVGRLSCKQNAEGKNGLQDELSLTFGLNCDALSSLPTGLQGYGLWQPQATDGKSKEKVWRLANSLGYGEWTEGPLALSVDAEALAQSAEIMVLDDGGLGFRVSTAQDAWPAFLRDNADAPQPEWVVLKMASPIAQGDLWRRITSKVPDRTILLVSIDDLRREEVRVTSGISWERTALDLVYEMQHNPALAPLKKCRHCIVSFGCEGALHIDYSDREKPEHRLIFDSQHMEGDWREAEGIKGGVFGYMSCLAAAVTTKLALGGEHESIDEGIMVGLAAMRKMHRCGHGKVGVNQPGVQFDQIAGEILSTTDGFATIVIPDDTSEVSYHSWTAMSGAPVGASGAPEPLYGVARRVAILGPSALKDIPYQVFGKLFTVDRNEIESLRNLRQLMEGYKDLNDGEKPLSLAVFGAPGSGKSFSVKQIAKAVLGKQVPILEFNLSQFTGTEELIGALHQVRDKVLEGPMPVVFWDEFDSKKYQWLQYLLAPMQDGAFQEGQIVHPIGKCVFVFAGGTSYDFENFGPPESKEAEFKDFKLAKGPDFKSRLSGYLNVLGPNCRQNFNTKTEKWEDDPTDVCYPVRRAILLRVYLKHFGDQRLTIDGGVLSAFLELSRFNHGARSMEKIVEQVLSRGAPGQVRRSDLPPAELMSMHADYNEFMSIANRDLNFQSNAEDLAPYIHEFYRELYPSDETNMPFDKLPENYKADNIAAARRIPQVLGLIGLYLVPQDTPSEDTDEEIRKLLEEYIDLLGEAEHEGWMEFKQQNGWKKGSPKSDKLRVSPLLVPYAELTSKQKHLDHNAVSRYPDIASKADYTIVSSLPRVK